MSIFRSIAQGAVAGAVGNRSAGRGLLGAGLGLVATRIATRSLPGALIVGGALVAKTLWDRKRERDRASEVEAAFDEAADMKRARVVEPDETPAAKPAPRTANPRTTSRARAKASPAEPAQLARIPRRKPRS